MKKIAATGVLLFLLIMALSDDDGRPRATATSSSYTVVPPRAPDPHEKVDLKFLRWEKGGFGSIGLVWLQFTNNNDYPIKDISVRCNFSAPSGTQLSVARQTVYIPIGAGKTAKSGEMNMGFIDSQSSRASCEVYDAVQAGPPVAPPTPKPEAKNAPAPSPKPANLKGVY